MARNRVVGVRHHDFGGEGRLTVPDALALVARACQVVQDPLLVSDLFGDVFGDRTAHPVLVGAQARAGGHHQRYGVADMVECLRQEAAIVFDLHVASEASADDRSREQVVPLAGGLALQSVEERRHDGPPSSASSFANAHSIASRRGRPLGVYSPAALDIGRSRRRQAVMRA